MLSFIFIDGPDSIGKSTICENLCNSGTLNSNGIIRNSCLPSDTGPLKFIRDLVKSKDFKTDNFSRQLLHCCSHIHSFEYEAYNYSKYKDNIDVYTIFDRGPLSTLVYGSLLIDNIQSIMILNSINLNILDYLMDSNQLDKIYFINLTRDNPYRVEDNSYYEQISNFNSIKLQYDMYIPNFMYYFKENSKVKFFNVNLSNKELDNADSITISKYIESLIINN